ncbi:hypothetical protein F4777DRAFT_396883 [Nemania sp. FL0916]|nr:hypothetical protein F4777DRAFT_396883 [Nemania sp. FL0916]
MHLSKLALLASACSTALATPAAHNAARAAKLPLPSRTIFQLDDSIPMSWFENVAVRQNGDVLVTMMSPEAAVYSLEKPLSGSPKVSRINITDANGLLGITETSPDVFVVVGGTFSTIGVPVAETMGAWEINLRGPKPVTRLITLIPEAVYLNGIETIPSCTTPAVLIADNGNSRVYRLELKTGKYETVAADIPEMQPLPNATLPIGVNGLKIRGGDLYFSNSNRASVFRVPINSEGFIAKGAGITLVAKYDKDNIDDFLIDEHGEYWAATNFMNTVDVAKLGGTGVTVLGKPTELTVAGDTALALGRTKADKNIIYVSTGGALNRPVNGTITEPAKVVAIDRTGYK